MNCSYQPLPSEEAWSNAICADSTEDSQLPDLLISVCAYLVNTLCDACKIPHAKITSSDVDSASFSLELRSFLSDYGAPFPPGFDLLERPSRKRVLVNFLVAEVEACRLIKRRSPEFNLLVPGTNQTANRKCNSTKLAVSSVVQRIFSLLFFVCNFFVKLRNAVYCTEVATLFPILRVLLTEQSPL